MEVSFLVFGQSFFV